MKFWISRKNWPAEALARAKEMGNGEWKNETPQTPHEISFFSEPITLAVIKFS